MNYLDACLASMAAKISPASQPVSRERRESADLGTYELDDLTIALAGSSAYRGSEGGSSEPVTQVIHKSINSLGVGSFKG
jgi:hypothetical protein